MNFDIATMPHSVKIVFLVRMVPCIASQDSSLECPSFKAPKIFVQGVILHYVCFVMRTDHGRY